MSKPDDPKSDAKVGTLPKSGDLEPPELTTTMEVQPPFGKTTREHVAAWEEASLIMLIGETVGRKYTVGKQGVTIGRGGKSTVLMTSQQVSREHAHIARREDRFFITDLGSRNGTEVNGIPINGELELKFGDKVSVASTSVFLFTHFDHLEEQMLHAQKMESIGRLAGGVAHDFNNLLGAILANLSFLQTLPKGATLDSDDVAESLKDAEGAAKRAVELTRQLLGFARGGKYEERPVDVGNIVRDAARLLKRTFNPSIELEVDADPGLIAIGDRSQIHQILMNLCINARDAIKSDGRILVEARSRELHEIPGTHSVRLNKERYIVLRVEDSGSGMDSAVKNRVFEPFFTTKPFGAGTGLGMATVYGIVKNHGGEILVESEEGQGSCFFVYIPQANVEPDFVRSRNSTGDLTLEGVLLIVDDDDLFRKATVRVLKSFGYRVLEARDGTEALAMYQEHRDEIDLVLLDLIMPNMGGEETYFALRQLNPDLKVIVTSGYSDAKKARKLVSSGIHSFLQKPADRDTLSRTIRTALTR